MLGAIIGDIVGSRFEFNNTDSKDFKLFTDDCSFTDDTICTVAIADAIVNNSCDYRFSLLDWCRRYPNPMGGYGCGFNRWINSTNPQPYQSYGNGSAMRVAPVAWWFDQISDVQKEAANTASVTHDHPEGIKGAVAVAVGIRYLRSTVNQDNSSAMRGFRSSMSYYYPHYEKEHFEPGEFNETCQGTVPLAFQILERSTGFEDAIRNAIAFGGDSDTLGAIVGSLAEARWGIPEEIYSNAMRYLDRDQLIVIGKFYNRLNNKFQNQSL